MITSAKNYTKKKKKKNVLNSVLPPERHWPDTWLEHQDPVSHTAQKKGRKKERKNKKK